MAEYTRTAQSQVTLSQAAGTHRGGPGRCSASPVAVRRSAQRPAPRVIIAAAATAIRIEMCVLFIFSHQLQPKALRAPTSYTYGYSRSPVDSEAETRD